MSFENNPFFQHILECNHLTKQPRFPLFLGEEYSGWIALKTAQWFKQNKIESYKEGYNLANAKELDVTEDKLLGEDFFQSLHEDFDVTPTPSSPVFGEVDRGAIPFFGFIARGVHLNGLVRKNGQLFLWVGRRSPHKKLDPGKLDHIAAGGVPAGYTPHEAIIKEAAEEAGIDEALTQNAEEKGRIVYALDRPEGLRRDILFCYDLYLPETFQPKTVDGEVESFELFSLDDIYELVRDTRQFKFNVDLAHIDLLLRHGYIDPNTSLGRELRQSLRKGISPLSPGRTLEEGLRFLKGQ